MRSREIGSFVRRCGPWMTVPPARNFLSRRPIVSREKRAWPIRAGRAQVGFRKQPAVLLAGAFCLHFAARFYSEDVETSCASTLSD
jgi:hypothetical protein